MRERFDFIVVGVSAAEAALAALLARDGYAVLLAGIGESNADASEDRNRFHCLPPLQSGLSDGPYARIAAYAGAHLPVARREPAWRMHFAQQIIDIPADAGQWRRLRRALFPIQRDAAERFWQVQETAAAAALRLAAQFDPLTGLQVWRQQRLTVGDMFRRYDLVDLTLRAFVDTILLAHGLPVSDHCSWAAGSIALLPPHETLVGHGDTLTHIFTDALIRAGGEWSAHHQVVELLADPTGVRGVRLKSGSEVAGRVVVLGPAGWPLISRRLESPPMLAIGALTVEEAQLPSGLPWYHIVAGEPVPVIVSLTPSDNHSASWRLSVMLRLRLDDPVSIQNGERQPAPELVATLQSAVCKVLPELASKITLHSVTLLPDPTRPTARPPMIQAGLWLLRQPAWLPPGYDNGSGTLRLYRQLRGLIR
ncbi:hypothetical protein [Chloroflexus sp.]|uniref:hypothetical protein n=1 Tax=Chloroflexus sp. TaxID=1904827 RepID=UPI002603EAAC|nr:hypothetical protein [uncultured Chloroflexus sp.]